LECFIVYLPVIRVCCFWTAIFQLDAPSRTRYLLDIFKISIYLSGVFFLLASYRYLLNIYKNIIRLSYL
jgi:hypothetical protein